MSYEKGHEIVELITERAGTPLDFGLFKLPGADSITEMRVYEITVKGELLVYFDGLGNSKKGLPTGVYFVTSQVDLLSKFRHGFQIRNRTGIPHCFVPATDEVLSRVYADQDAYERAMVELEAEFRERFKDNTVEQIYQPGVRPS